MIHSQTTANCGCKPVEGQRGTGLWAGGFPPRRENR